MGAGLGRVPEELRARAHRFLTQADSVGGLVADFDATVAKTIVSARTHEGGREEKLFVEKVRDLAEQVRPLLVEFEATLANAGTGLRNTADRSEEQDRDIGQQLQRRAASRRS